MTAIDETRAVTQLAHALQCAAAAEAARPPEALVVAALLHDVGHLVHDLGPRPAERGIGDRHQARRAEWLARWFGLEVTEPVRLHVDATRYLCAVEPSYSQGLSPASVRSLVLQGGPFAAEAAALFIEAPYAADAVQLRRWDEAAKVAGFATPDIAHFAGAVRACVRA
jgi:phosphonate degradation associated HDIG domain protein